MKAEYRAPHSTLPPVPVMEALLQRSRQLVKCRECYFEVGFANVCNGMDEQGVTSFILVRAVDFVLSTILTANTGVRSFQLDSARNRGEYSAEPILEGFAVKGVGGIWKSIDFTGDIRVFEIRIKITQPGPAECNQALFGQS
jgi:hypothetical protein